MRSGPFGLEIGMSIEDFNVQLEEIAPYKYFTETPPKTHSAFESYIFEITPAFGLSWIKALGNELKTNPYGIELQSAFDAMKLSLEKKYGKYELVDFLMEGSIWDEPRDWMQAISDRERVLMVEWKPEYSSNLDESIASIALTVTASDTATGYIVLEYTFVNAINAEQQIAEIEDEAL